jgi:hypothetical protein
LSVSGRAAAPQWFCNLMRHLLKILAAAILCSGCGYVGEPLPPALHIPKRITDLGAVERGGQLIVQFTAPTETTEGLDIRKMGAIDLRVTPGGDPAAAKVFHPVPGDQSRIEHAIPAAEWVGKDIVIEVRIPSPKGRDSGWSNPVALTVVPPIAQPAAPEIHAVSEGVQVSWPGSAPRYRVFRRVGEVSTPALLSESGPSEYLDTTAEYGKTYHYSVQGAQTGGNIHAESEISPEASITPEDHFPPSVPKGLAAVPSTGSIELTWDRNTEPDLAGYRVYRAEGSGVLERQPDLPQTPGYSDRKIETGRTYRYAVSSLDRTGNESRMSEPVQATAP